MIDAVRYILRSINQPKTNPINNWNSCNGLNCRRNIQICIATRMKFINIVYPPTVIPGIFPISPAIEKESGKEDITLLPKFERIDRETPSVIRKSEKNKSKCCQTNDIIRCLEGSMTVFIDFIIWLLLYQNRACSSDTLSKFVIGECHSSIFRLFSVDTASKFPAA